ncbi:MAG: nucleoside deaminase [Clostridia bacterium]|nr:nucleoside deaminase [Clostridia bacterium]
MKEALAEAQKAVEMGEVPVGAVLVKDKKIICRAHNLTETKKNPLAHAELLLIEKAFRVLDTHRLTGCSLYVTLEPCPMCAGAIRLARPDRVYFGAYDTIVGACGGKIDVLSDTPIEVYGGIMEQETGAILSDFFKNVRKMQ